MRLPLTVVVELTPGLGSSGIVRPQADGLGPDAVRRFDGEDGQQGWRSDGWPTCGWPT
ncbi:hypothetical protein [Streptomyces sp. DSM 15324]|uniref:hypothetical protein n=1 Tax=Streptomyces sp. DSM 15324 TaxID=1739111 RepID=UPI000A7369CF|nr:hypothetical protein [Streptomyces sp. DSM 15324]